MYADILTRADNLLTKRGITGHTAADRFVKDFKAYLVYYDAIGLGDAEKTVSLLEDDANLTDSSILNTNFRCTLNDLISESLRTDSIFPELFRILMDNNGKGVGAGELALPLILSNYRFSNNSDGVFDGDKKVEIKKDGASLKPVKTGLTEKGLVDQLNAKYWNNSVPGKRSKKLFETHIISVIDPAKYADYFRELYVGCDTTALAEEVIAGAWEDPEQFNEAVGRFALREYQKVDGWNNIIYINQENGNVVNIADTSDVSDLNLKFSPVMRRGKDTQAIADGYVNVSI
jgi:hypothetical protein